MPSRLRYQTSAEDSTDSIQTIRRTPTPPQKKQKMSLSQTYFVAASARTKLGKEACRPDHNLRLLVGHANLLDALMIDLHDAEREQEAWFNQTVQKAASPKAEQAPKHIQWMDTVDERMEEQEEYDEDTASETEDSDEEDSDLDVPAIPARRLRTAPVSVSSREMDIEDDTDDDEDDEEHALVRTVSGTSAHSPPPELVDDEDSEDDSSPPTSPPAAQLEFTDAQRKAIATTTLLLDDEEMSYAVDSAWEPTPSAPLVAAC